MTPRRLAWLGVAGLCALAGCANGPGGPDTAQRVAADRAVLADAALCCDSLAAARQADLPAQKALVNIDRSQQVFNFDGNKAYFVLYRLPPFIEPYAVQISSRAGGTPQDATVLVPRVALYDERYRLTRHFDEAGLRKRGNHLERTVFIHADDAQERFMAVYGADLAVTVESAAAELTYTPIMAGGVMFTLHGGRDVKALLRYAPTGAIEIEVSTPGKAGAGAPVK